MKQFKFEVAIFLGGVFTGMIIGVLLLGPYTQDAERHRAIKARVAEWYLNSNRELKFRYLTEHKEE